jgi:putative transposase
LNAFAERFVRSIKKECLQRMIFFGEDALRTAVHEYIAHYHTERNHQGLGNQLIIPITTEEKSNGPVRRKQRLGGTLSITIATPRNSGTATSMAWERHA